MKNSLRIELKVAMEKEGFTYDEMIRGGFGFKKNGHVYGITPLDNLPDPVRRDAKKETSVWHVLLPIDGSSKGDKMGGARPREETLAGHSRKHRGKHRTHTKGKGFNATNRQFDSLNLRKQR